MSDLSDYAREVQAASDSSWRKQEAVIKDLKCRIEELEAKLATASHNAAVFGHKIVDLEAKLAVAVEALEYIKETLSLYSAKEALAKIKGEQP